MITTNNQSIIFPDLINNTPVNNPRNNKIDLVQLIRQWLDEIEITNIQLAKLITKMIPAQCPFERDIVIFGHKVAHIPPLCKLNPLYEQFVGLRFRALCYLVDECGEDIQSYC